MIIDFRVGSLRAVAALFAALLTAGCSAGNEPQRFTAAAEVAEVPTRGRALRWSESEVLIGMGATPANVAFYSAQKAEALDDVTLVSARPLELDEGLELVDARVVINRDSATGMGQGAHLGTCTNVWPPAGYGNAYRLAEFALRRGDQVTVRLYVRPARGMEGRAHAKGLEVVYRDSSGQLRVQTAEPGTSGNLAVDVHPDPAVAGREFGMCGTSSVHDVEFQPLAPEYVLPGRTAPE